MKLRVLIFTLTVIIITCALLGVVGILKPVFRSSTSSDDTIVYFRLNDKLDYTNSSLDVVKVIKEAIGKPLVKAAKYNVTSRIDLLFFETLNMIDQLMQRIEYPLSIKYIYGVAGSDLMANKAFLADILYSKYAADAEEIIPKTYIIDKQGELKRLETEFNEKNVYILKKNLQRQEGFIMSNSLQQILDISKDYVVCQKMLQDPYILNGRKINLRVYMLVVVRNEMIEFYYFDNGFLYYTPEYFKPNSTDPKQVITTGYIDRSVYKENPMTFRDLETFLGNDKYDKLMINIHMLLKKVKVAYSDKILFENASIPGTKFLVYGCDIAPNSQLSVQLMEINKGPDLGYKDDRDKMVKLTMVQQVMNIVGINKGNSKSFVRV